MTFIILAGGLGSRFVKEGYKCPKPLVPLFGEPMIGRLIRILSERGADKIFVGANADMPQLIEYLDSLVKKGYPVVTRPILTDNSFETLKCASEGVEGRFIAITCDAIFIPDEFDKYVDAVENARPDEAIMGLTHFVEDESPLYANIDASGTVVDYRYGGEPFSDNVVVSAGLYGLSDDIMTYIARNEIFPQSLSDFQRILAAHSPFRLIPFDFSIAFDVDNSRDQVHAEQFLASL